MRRKSESFKNSITVTRDYQQKQGRKFILSSPFLKRDIKEVIFGFNASQDLIDENMGDVRSASTIFVIDARAEMSKIMGTPIIDTPQLLGWSAD